jgi:chromate transporter
MNAFVLYLVLLKATMTTFAGLASLPVVRDDLVVKRQVLTDTQLNESVVITRSTPGPVGLYVVSVGYFAAGVPGAVAGWLAMITPALLIIPLVHFAGKKAEHRRAKAALQAVVVASSGLLLASVIPLAQSALVDAVTVLIALVTVVLMLRTKLDTLWLILGAALTTLSASSIQTLLAA